MNVAKIIVALAPIAIFAGCSSANSPAIPLPSGVGAPVTTKPASSAAKSGASFVFAIPSRSSVKSIEARKPDHLPSTSQSFSVRVSYASNATTGTPGTIASSTNVDATTCPVLNGAKTCTVTASLIADSYVVDVANYDAPGESGNVLSQVVAAPFTVAAGTVNSVPITLVGVPRSIVVMPDPTSPLANHVKFNPGAGVNELAGTAPVPMTVFGVDADGNVITVGAPTFTNVTASSNDPSSVIVGSPVGPTFTIQTASLGRPLVTVNASASYRGSTFSTQYYVFSVEELLVVGGAAIDGYGSFSSGLSYLDTTTIPGTNVGGTIRTDASRKVVYALDVNSGTFYSIAAGAAPAKMFTNATLAGAAAFAVSPDGASFYVTNRNANAIYRVSSASGALMQTLSVSQPIEDDFDSAGTLYAAEINFSGTIAELASGGTSFNQSFIRGLYYPASFRVGNAAEGGYLYVGQDNGSGAVVRYTPSGVSGVGGPQASSFAFDAAGDAYMVNGYANPVTVTGFASGRAGSTVFTALPGKQISLPAGRASGEAEFII